MSILKKISLNSSVPDKFIESNFINLTDLYSRGQTFKKVSIDESYPDYIRNNLDKYKQFILDDTNK